MNAFCGRLIGDTGQSMAPSWLLSRLETLKQLINVIADSDHVHIMVANEPPQTFISSSVPVIHIFSNETTMDIGNAAIGCMIVDANSERGCFFEDVSPDSDIGAILKSMGLGYRHHNAIIDTIIEIKNIIDDINRFVEAMEEGAAIHFYVKGSNVGISMISMSNMSPYKHRNFSLMKNGIANDDLAFQEGFSPAY